MQRNPAIMVSHALRVASRVGFALATAVLMSGVLRAQDVVEIDLYKRAWYQQTGDRDPELLPMAQDPYDLDVTASLSADALADPEFLSGMTLQTPGGLSRAMSLDESYGFGFTEGAVSQAALSIRYGPGTYQLTLSSLLTGNQKYNTSLPEDAYPPAARVVNYLAAQKVNPTNDFTLQWTGFTVTADLYAMVMVADADSFSTVFVDGPFAASQKASTIAANTLETNRTYLATVILRRLTLDSPATLPSLYSGFESYNLFSLRTSSGGGAVLEAPVIQSISLRADHGVDLAVKCTAGYTLGIEGTAQVGGAWRSLQTLTPQATPATVTIPAADLGTLQFLRAYQE